MKRSIRFALSKVVGRIPFLVPMCLFAVSASGSDQALIKKGRKIYEESCSACHQADAIGKAGFAPSLTNPEFLSISSDSFLRSNIMGGREGTGMPPFAHLGEPDVNAIIAYLRSFATLPDRAAEVDAQPEARGDPRLGSQWYEYICSTCHGGVGEGYETGGPGTAIGRSGFLDRVSDGYIRTTIKEGRSNTRMLGFKGPASMANLSDQEIDDIIVYIRTMSAKQ
jgi:mono/diheme cytochrome c family protein